MGRKPVRMPIVQALRPEGKLSAPMPYFIDEKKAGTFSEGAKFRWPGGNLMVEI